MNDLGTVLNLLNKDLNYNLPNYGPAIGQFSQDITNYDGVHTTVAILQNDYNALLGALS